MQLRLLFLLSILQLSNILFGFNPIGGYINHKKLNNNRCIIDDSRFQIDAIIFFENQNIPDSVLFDFGDGHSNYAKYSSLEPDCNGIAKGIYTSEHTFIGCGSYAILIFIDSNTFFDGNNIKGNMLFFMASYFSLSESDMENKDFAKINLNAIRINVDSVERFSIPIEAEGNNTYSYAIDTKYFSKIDGLVLNPQTGSFVISNLKDTGISMAMVVIDERTRFGSLRNTFVVILNIKNNITWPKINLISDSLKIDKFSSYFVNTGLADTVKINLAISGNINDTPNLQFDAKIPNLFLDSTQIVVFRNDTFWISRHAIINPFVFARMPVSVNINAKINDSNECVNIQTSFYLKDKSDLASINYHSKSILKPQFYPNPTDGFFKFYENNLIQNDKLKSIEIYDMMGKSVPFKLLENEIDISFLPEGIYLVKLVAEQSVFSSKIIKH